MAKTRAELEAENKALRLQLSEAVLPEDVEAATADGACTGYRVAMGLALAAAEAARTTIREIIVQRMTDYDEFDCDFMLCGDAAQEAVTAITNFREDARYEDFDPDIALGEMTPD